MLTGCTGLRRGRFPRQKWEREEMGQNRKNHNKLAAIVSGASVALVFGYGFLSLATHVAREGRHLFSAIFGG